MRSATAEATTASAVYAISGRSPSSRRFCCGTPLPPPRAGTIASSGRRPPPSGRGACALILLAVLVPEVGVVGVLASLEPRAARRVVQELRGTGHVVQHVPLLRDVADLLVVDRLEAVQ